MTSDTNLMKQSLTHAYESFAQGDWPGFLRAFPENVTFQVAGRSKLAGKFTKATFAQDYGARMKELSGGGFQVEIHDVMVSDRHATVLATTKLSRDGKKYELRSVHVWRTEGGALVAGYEYPRDLYAFDEAWG